MSGRIDQGRNAMMGTVPIEPHSLASLAAFDHFDPRALRASINLIPATLPIDLTTAAQHSHSKASSAAGSLLGPSCARANALHR